MSFEKELGVIVIPLTNTPRPGFPKGVNKELEDYKTKVKKFDEAAEMLWVVIANTNQGDWGLQTKEWQEATAKWRDNYFKARKELGL